MTKALLDTNFILTCVRQKIDFFDELSSEGISIIIPEQVINEIKKFEDKKSEANSALKLLKNNLFKKIDIGKGHVDKKIINYAKENPETIIATLDREIKSKIKNKKLVIKGKKKLEII